jgi:GAF domain-containing protein
VIVDDLSEIELVSPVLRDSGLRSIVAVPVLAGERLLGVLHAGSYQLGRFTAADAELLEMLADRLALALSRVRLFDEQVRLAKMCSFFTRCDERGCRGGRSLRRPRAIGGVGSACPGGHMLH